MVEASSLTIFIGSNCFVYWVFPSKNGGFISCTFNKIRFCSSSSFSLFRAATLKTPDAPICFHSHLLYSERYIWSLAVSLGMFGISFFLSINFSI